MRIGFIRNHFFLILWSLIFIFCFCIYNPATVYAADVKVDFKLNQIEWTPQWNSILEGGQTFIPIRSLASECGAQNLWQKESQLIFFVKGQHAVAFHPNLDSIFVFDTEENPDGSSALVYKKIPLEHNFLLKDGQSYIGANALVHLHMIKSWDNKTKSMTIILDDFIYRDDTSANLSMATLYDSINEVVKKDLDEVKKKAQAEAQKKAQVEAQKKAQAEAAKKAQEQAKKDQEKKSVVQPVPNAIIIGSYTSGFDKKNKDRTTNLHLSAAALNGKTLSPGQVFSFNDTVGRRTPSRGYLKAIIFVDGKPVLDYGGGVCQVSSTLYNAVAKAKLTIVERHNHSLEVTYVPKGQDATVFYGQKDFRFRNDSTRDIVIRAVVDERKSKLIIQIWKKNA